MLYKIISSTNLESVKSQVNIELDQEWELYGYFQVATFTNDMGVMEIMLFQPMIKRERFEDDPIVGDPSFRQM